MILIISFKYRFSILPPPSTKSLVTVFLEPEGNFNLVLWSSSVYCSALYTNEPYGIECKGNIFRRNLRREIPKKRLKKNYQKSKWRK